ncbi:MAG TPA: ATP-binding protein [Gammaproteobacteria bacterium]|jgi:signal transduction histidine kinase
MPRSLYAKLSLVLIFLLASIGIIYTVVSVSTTRHYLEEVNQNLNRDLAKNLVADRNLVAEGRIDDKALKEMFHEYMVINPSIEIYLLDLQGRILSYSADPKRVKRKSVSLGPVYDFLGGKAMFPILGDDPRSHERRKAFSVTPVPSASDAQGYLYVVLRGEEFDTVDALLGSSHFYRLGAFAVTGGLTFGLVVGLLVFFLLTRRLRRLAETIDRFRRSGFTDHAPYAPRRGAVKGDEIDQLGESFDHMAERIVKQIDELRLENEFRREMAANISHDLRTPLSSLHGYLETLHMKAGELSDEERKEYLNTALRQSERLRRLVSELFELAKLDAPGLTPGREPFSAPDLVQDVAQKFKLRAEQAEVTIQVDPRETVPLVSGDVALVERLLENLLDNALRNTPPGGAVRIPIHRLNGEVEIAVADTGKGIPEEAIGKIFDRFYQVENEHRGSGHTGLGLAIAKRIVELHRGELVVDSELDHGTTFSFRLPVWLEPKH